VVSIYIDFHIPIFRKGTLPPSDFILFRKCVLHDKGECIKCILEPDDDWNVSTADGGSYARMEYTT